MLVESKAPAQLYQKISKEIDNIIESLTINSGDISLNQTNEDVRKQLTAFRFALDEDIERLNKNSEWDRFTIAFYGETNAGKSTIIETLRILLNEKSKQARRQAFRNFQLKHNIRHSDIDNLQRQLNESKVKSEQLSHEINTVLQTFSGRETELQQQLDNLKNLIVSNRRNASLWQRILNLLIKTAEQKEYALRIVEHQQLNIEKKSATAELDKLKVDCDAHNAALMQLQHAQSSLLVQLGDFADGEIIGSGKSDFTLDTTLYPFETGNQQFALLDVPGIEGKESKVMEQIQQAVEKAHAVFYVTSKATAPQKGDDNNPGTLEKIKSHLSAQTEVWTLFNKRITNPIQLNRPAMLSADEQHSLETLNEKMREQLGDNYCDTYSLSAMPAFLSVAEFLVPDSENMRKREKLLEKLTPEQVLEKTGINDFLKLLTRTLVANSQQKIAKSNFNKARKSVEEAANTIQTLRNNNYEPLKKKLEEDKENTDIQLDASLKTLKARLLNGSKTAANSAINNIREKIYHAISQDISNDEFKNTLKKLITNEFNTLGNTLPKVAEHEIDRFKADTGEIITRFQDYSKDLLNSYSKIKDRKFDHRFELKIKIDNGINVTSLVASAIGGALMFWNPAGWVVLAPALAGLVFSAYKAVRSFFSSKYKKSQQRESAEKNLGYIESQISSSIENGIKGALPELENQIDKIKQTLGESVQHVAHISNILNAASTGLLQLSKTLTHAGEH